MRPVDVLEYVNKRPIQPFRLTLTDGRTYDVHHPEMAMVGLSSITIGLPPPGNFGGVYDRAISVSLLHVMQIELIEAVKTSGNGSNP